jgi:hypothetical protein
VDIPDDIPEDDTVGVPDHQDFIFKPECVALWPHQSTEVEVTLRTRFVGGYDALVEVLAFDSGHSQCIGAEAEVQLPRLRLSTQHAHFDVTYVKVASPIYELELFNDYDMPAPFNWNIPVKLEACIEVQIRPETGVVPPNGSVKLKLLVVPTRESEYAKSECQVFSRDVMQPLALEVSARVYGPEVDYALVPPGMEAPIITHVPRMPGEEPSGTYQVTCGKAPDDSPMFDFGEMELLKTKSMQLVLYNRTGIPTPFGISIEKYGAWDPLAKGKKVGALLDAATKMYSLATHDNSGANTLTPEELTMHTFTSEPQAVAEGRQPSAEPDPMAKETTKQLGTSKKVPMPRAKSRGASNSFYPKNRRTTTKNKAAFRYLLDSQHELQAFRSDVGADFALQKELKEQGMVALKSGRGYAVTVDPKSDWLQPFSRAVVTCTCYSDVPGLMEDQLIINIGQLQSHADGGDYRIPVRVLSVGNPLYLPDQQVGLRNRLDLPRLLMETITPVDKNTTRTFRVGNNSMTQVRLSWKITSQLQVTSNEEFHRTRAAAKEEAKKKKEAKQKGEVPLEAGKLHLSFGKHGKLDLGFYEVEVPEVDDAREEEELPPVVDDPFALADGEPPVKIEPAEALLPIQGTATFTVTMFASKATASSEGHYQYRLIGEGRYAQDPEAIKIEEDSNPVGQTAAMEMTQNPMHDNGSQRGSKSKVAQGVAQLPEIKLDDDELHDDDSDIERIPSGRKEADKTQKLGGANENEPVQDIMSTITIDCIGDCVVPRLIIDKKCDHDVAEFDEQDGRQVPVFKFVHSTVAPPNDKQRTGAGVKLLGQPGGTPHQGIASSLVREVNLANENACPVHCRFRADGPFRIRMIEQAGKKPVVPPVAEKTIKNLRPKEGDNPDDPMRQLFAVPARSSITLSVEFAPSMVPRSQWTANVEHTFRGDVIVEYPRDGSLQEAGVDLQRIHLLGTSRKPSIRINLIPYGTMEVPKQLTAEALLIEFGSVHVETTIARTRAILLSSENNVIARWSFVHVGRKHKKVDATMAKGEQKDDEDFNALDDMEAFAFDVSDGVLLGPSKDGLVPGSDVRMPSWCPTTPALPKRLGHADADQFEPKKVIITFKPKKNEVYKCRFRVQVEDGHSVDFICRGRGSYNEEDDAMEYQEA